MRKSQSQLPELDILAIQARIETRKTELEEAISSSRERIGINLEDPLAHLQLGRALLERALKGERDFSEAETTSARAIELFPDASEAHVLLGRVYSYSGKHEQAYAVFRRALALEPNNVAANIQIAVRLGLTGHHKEALQLFDRAIELNPQLAEPHYEKGVLLHNMGRTGEALPHLDQAVQLEPMNPQFYNRRGLILAKLGNVAQATTDYEQVVKLEPENPDYWFNLALILMQIPNRLQEAADILEKLTVVHEAPANVQLYLGQVHYLLKNNIEAKTAYQRSLTIKPTSIAHYGLAMVHLEQGDNPAVLQDLNAALGIAGTDANMWSADLEICQKILGMLGHPTLIDTRILALQKLITLDPNFPAYYSELATALEIVGKIGEALSALDNLLILCQKDLEGRKYIPQVQRLIKLLKAKLRD